MSSSIFPFGPSPHPLSHPPVVCSRWIWLTDRRSGLTNDGGDPQSPYFAPAECDTTLQTETRWFWAEDQPLRSLEEMVDVYHRTVGRNCQLELDLAPDRRGLVPDRHAERYRQLGDFIRACYGAPVTPAAAAQNETGVYALAFDQPTPIDRVVLMEDQTDGQVIRSFEVYAQIADGEPAGSSWTRVVAGSSVGHKRIALLDGVVTVTSVMVNTTYVDVPKWRSVTAHLCDQVGRA